MKISETEAYAMLQSFFHFDQKIGDVSQDVVKMAVDEIKTLFKNLPNNYYINTT